MGLTLIWKLLSLPASQRVTDHHLWRWFSAGKWELDLGIRVDPLSLTFVGLVTFVGFLIHVYSVAYMSHDRDRRRFFAYLNLFVAAMLTLVLGNSYLACLWVGKAWAWLPTC